MCLGHLLKFTGEELRGIIGSRFMQRLVTLRKVSCHGYTDASPCEGFNGYDIQSQASMNEKANLFQKSLYK